MPAKAATAAKSASPSRTACPAFLAWRGISGRERAIEVFSNLRVWDTEHNSGVLVYLLLADHDIEIVADRGIAARVDHATWEAVAQTMEAAFRQGEFERGALEGIGRSARCWRNISRRPGIIPTNWRIGR
jgi:uncharacterized membrane protein